MLAVVEMVFHSNSFGESAEMSCIHTVEKKNMQLQEKIINLSPI